MSGSESFILSEDSLRGEGSCEPMQVVPGGRARYFRVQGARRGTMWHGMHSSRAAGQGGGSREQKGSLWDGMEMRGILASQRDWLRERGLVVEERRRGRGEEEEHGAVHCDGFSLWAKISTK